jgi:hypothetical protein
MDSSDSDSDDGLESHIQIVTRQRQAEIMGLGYSFGAFETNMNVAADRRIITFSDLHGDLEALLVCLRDCAGVIRKKPRLDGSLLFDPSVSRDPELDTFLQLDINHNLYRRDLNYEWVMTPDVASTIVVIIGDLLDPVRPDTYINPDTGVPDFYYPQIELKLLHFINALNENSLVQHEGRADYGRIMKLCGNHEIINFIH